MQIPVRHAVFSSPDYPFDPVSAPVKLDQNESSEDFPDDLKALVLKRVAAAEWNRYPDLHADTLCAAIAGFEQWSPSGVVVTTGSNVLISLLIQLSALGGRVVTVKSNFALYGLDAQLLGSRLSEVPLREDHSVDFDAVIAALEGASAHADEPAGVIYLPRPHAPTGSQCPLDALERLAQLSRGWLLVIDEAYVHFGEGSAAELARRHAHVVLLRTFSKAWGLAGARVGYALSSDAVARQLRKLVPPFAVSVMQSECIRVALENPGYMHERVQGIVRERDRITRALSDHTTWKVSPSSGNFLLIRTPDAQQAFDHLLTNGVLVRRQDRHFGLEGCIRVTVGTRAENDAFLRAAHAAPR
ncbi:MAG: histidinol-phosphate transaminase [Hydrogenophaga sp.]|nr:histidinol-phosphate transaminase [Hydrogenophaga sp.]